MIDVICPKDGTLHYADESTVGKTLRCRTCGATLTIGLQDQAPPIEAKQEPAVEKAAASVPGAPVVKPQTEIGTPQKLTRRGNLLVGAALGAIVVILLITFWPHKPSYDSSQLESGGHEPAVGETSTEPSLGVTTPTPKRRPNVKPGQTNSVHEGDLPGAPPPCAQGRQPLRLKTGERIEPDGGVSGASNIRVLNAGGLDAAVKLVDSVTGETARFVYVQAGHSFAIEGIETGAYLLQFQFGRDWIPECHEFMRDSDYREFAAPFVFLDDRVRFYEATLSSAAGGKTITRRISRKRFLESGEFGR